MSNPTYAEPLKFHLYDSDTKRTACNSCATFPEYASTVAEINCKRCVKIAERIIKSRNAGHVQNKVLTSGTKVVNN